MPFASFAGGFRKYDFGSAKNQRLYGSPEPPSYNISAIGTPLYVFYGTADNLVNEEVRLECFRKN